MTPPTDHAPRLAPHAPRSLRRILIVRPSALGDVARTVPALVTLRQAYPDAQIDWLVQTPFADVIRHHPALTTAIGWDRQWVRKLTRGNATLMGGLRFAKALYDTGYDAVYDLQGLARSGMFAWITRAPHRVGFADARELGWLGYNARHSVNGSHVHAVDRMLALLEMDGLTPVRDLRLYVGDDDARHVEATLQDARSKGFPRDYVCLAPTARWGSKRWPLDRYAEVARRLRAARPDLGLVVLAAPNELAEVMPAFAGLDALFPKTTVGQLMAFLRGSRLLVANDSAALHIAVGFDRPIVAIFGPTNPLEVGPYGKLDCVLQPPEAKISKFNYRDHRDDATLVSKLTVDDVWSKVETTLAAT